MNRTITAPSGNASPGKARPGRTGRAAIVAAGVALAALLLSACTSTGSSTNDTASSVAKVVGGASQVRVTMKNTGGDDVCVLDSTRAKAGAVTFTLKNENSTAITELELQSDQRILGEKENLAPGLGAVSFTVTLTGGKYQVYCPGAKKQLQTFTVTGKVAQTSTTAQGALQSGIAGYAAYVTQEVTNMISATDALNKAVASGDLAASQKAYALARPYYERIESDVDGFVLPGFSPTDNAGNLDYLIDMRASNLDPKVGWHGFHAVEKDLFQAKKITDGTKKLAAELDTNVKRLDALTKTLTYKPEDLANGASGLLEEVQSSKISGEEEAYSHIDLVDFAANVEGAQQAFAYLQPGLTIIDPALTKTVVSQFTSVNTLLDKYKDPSALGGYVAYTAAVKAADAPTLSAAVEALHENLAKIAEKVATA
jgi:iron uptake system component EfeO